MTFRRKKITDLCEKQKTNDDINIREEKMRMRNRNIESKTDIFVKKIVNLYEKRKARMTSISKKIINLYKKQKVRTTYRRKNL